MKEQQMREYVNCGLATEEEYELLKSVLQDVSYEDIQARKLAYLTFCYRAGDITEEEYQNAVIYKEAKKNDR